MSIIEKLRDLSEREKAASKVRMRLKRESQLEHQRVTQEKQQRLRAEYQKTCDIFNVLVLPVIGLIKKEHIKKLKVENETTIQRPSQRAVLRGEEPISFCLELDWGREGKTNHTDTEWASSYTTYDSGYNLNVIVSGGSIEISTRFRRDESVSLNLDEEGLEERFKEAVLAKILSGDCFWPRSRQP